MNMLVHFSSCLSLKYLDTEWWYCGIIRHVISKWVSNVMSYIFPCHQWTLLHIPPNLWFYHTYYFYFCYLNRDEMDNIFLFSMYFRNIVIRIRNMRFCSICSKNFLSMKPVFFQISIKKCFQLQIKAFKEF